LTRRFATEISILVGPDRDIPAPDVGTNAQVMAWFMDTLSMHRGYSVTASVTGKPVEVGGSLGRADATGRGVMICTVAALETMGLKPFNQRVVVQGFGNVGSVSARLLEEAGCQVVAVSEDYGGIYNPLGMSVRKLIEYRAREHTLKGFPGAELVPNEDLLKLDCDVLVPAALENQITSTNAHDIKAKLVVEGANGPTTPEADEILRKRGVILVPDILANAGGVTVSYFEWVQDLQSFFWSEHEINARLESIMTRSFKEVLAIRDEKKVDLRMAAYLLAVNRVAVATADRGIYP
jgi:glutamate dehydrogenase (NAD(P)+)